MSNIFALRIKDYWVRWTLLLLILFLGGTIMVQANNPSFSKKDADKLKSSDFGQETVHRHELTNGEIIVIRSKYFTEEELEKLGFDPSLLKNTTDAETE